jgi:hypothetical protein
MKLKKYTDYNNKDVIITNKESKNENLINKITKLSLDTIKESDIIDLVCNYGLCVEDRDAYGERNQYMIYNRKEESKFQTPKKFAEAI